MLRKKSWASVEKKINSEFGTKNKDFKWFAVKCAVIGLCAFLSIWVAAFVWVALGLAVVSILTTWNGRALYYVWFTLPMFNILSPNRYSFTLFFWVVFVCVMMLGFLYFVRLQKGRVKFNWWVFVPVVLFLVKSTVVFATSPFDLITVWLGLPFVCLVWVFRKDLDIKEVVFVFLMGLGFTVFTGAFVNVSPRLFALINHFENRFNGGTFNPNVLSYFCVVALGLVYYLFLKKQIRFLLYPLVALLVAVILLSGSKTGAILMVCLLAMFAVMMFLRDGRGKKTWGSIGLVAGVYVVVMLCLLNQTAWLFGARLATDAGTGDMDTFTTYRWSIWAEMFPAVFSSWHGALFGHGVGGFASTYYAHNMFLQLLYSHGFVGVGLLLWIGFAMIGFTLESHKNFWKRIDWFSLVAIGALLANGIMESIYTHGYFLLPMVLLCLDFSKDVYYADKSGDKTTCGGLAQLGEQLVYTE